MAFLCWQFYFQISDATTGLFKKFNNCNNYNAIKKTVCSYAVSK